MKKYDGIIWKTVSLALKDLDLHVKHSEALRSLLCTATNTTPHELMSEQFRRSHYHLGFLYQEHFYLETTIGQANTTLWSKKLPT